MSGVVAFVLIAQLLVNVALIAGFMWFVARDRDKLMRALFAPKEYARLEARELGVDLLDEQVPPGMYG